MKEPCIDLRLGDCLDVMKALEAGSIHTCVTSPPYFGLRDYKAEGQIGLETTPDAYVARMVSVFREVRRLLRDDGTLWLNLGDSYSGAGGYSPDSPVNVARRERGSHRDGAFRVSTTLKDRLLAKGKKVAPGLKPKDLIGIPWRVAFALQADGWYLRSDIIWHKTNPMPESVKDRPTKSHEYIFLFAKSERYHYDADAIKEPSSGDSGYAKQRAKGKANWSKGTVLARSLGKGGTGGEQVNSLLVDTGYRNRRSVWTVATRPYKDAHFATFPPQLIEPCILAGCPVGGIVLDPFSGAGTTGLVATQHGRSYVGIELNPDYLEMARKRLATP